MRRSLRLRLGTLGAAAAAALAVAGAASTAPAQPHATTLRPYFAVVQHTLGQPSTTFRFNLGTSTAVAAIRLYAPKQAIVPALPLPGETVGDASGTFWSVDRKTTLPVTGTITALDPATAPSSACASGTHAGAWRIDFRSGSQALSPAMVFLDPTSGPTAQLGRYQVVVCFASAASDQSAATRSILGAQPATLTLRLNGIFLRTAGWVMGVWRAVFTPYQAGKSVQDTGSQVEARSWVGGLVQLKARYLARRHAFQLLGGVHRGSAGVPGLRVLIYKGVLGQRLVHVASVRTNSRGVFRTAGNLRPLRTTFFQARATIPARLHVQHCDPTLPSAGAPCVGTTFGGWSGASAIARIKL